ncbi:MAG: mechanosensitive ion channel [Phycisphaerales bacterium]|nr:mechanosensitive ion channel [Phycisphaerales bacterium]
MKRESNFSPSPSRRTRRFFSFSPISVARPTGCSAAIVALAAAASVAFTGSARGDAQESAKPRGGDPASPASSPSAGQEPETDAERISRLKRTIEETEKHLDELRGKLEDPNNEYARAESEFQQLDVEKTDKKKELQKLADAGSGQLPEAVRLEEELTALEPRWKLAKDRFDLAIAERKTLQQQIQTQEEKLQQDRVVLEGLLNPPATASKPDAAPPPAGSPAGTAPASTTGAPATTPQSAPPTNGAAPVKTESPSTGVPSITVPGFSTVPPSGTTGPPPAGAPGSSVPSPPAAAKPPSPELVKAQKDAEAKESRAEHAQREVESIVERINSVRTGIELERKLLETARGKADNAQETQRTLSEEARTKWAEGAPQSALQELWTKTDEARQRLLEARQEVNDRVDRIDAFRAEMERLQADRIAALEAAEAERVQADAAHRRVEHLENPFAPGNLLKWAVDHGPRLGGILLGMLGLLWLARVLDKRIVHFIAGHVERGTMDERENRARTLVGVFHNAANIAVIGGGILMLLAEVGVNIIPLLGGAAVAGLAIAFGAQNLVRDYFSGFMMLMENQYGINDVIQIGTTSGLVERVTLRLTILRDLEGVVHFIPNGQITSVSNLTHGWSRAVFAIDVGYREDVNRVMAVLMELAGEMRRHEAYGMMILEDAEMLGVDQLGESSVVIKFVIKTRPLKQWIIKRELLRRIKNRFDELGIEMPYPHRTIVHKYDGPPATSSRDDVVETGRRPPRTNDEADPTADVPTAS